MTSLTRRNDGLKDDKMTSATQFKLKKIKTLISQIRSFTTKIVNIFCQNRPKAQKMMQILRKKNENDPKHSPKSGTDFLVPETSQNEDRNENVSPRGGKYNLRPNPNPNYSEDFRH